MLVHKIMKLFLTLGLIFFVAVAPRPSAAEVIGNRIAVIVGDMALSETEVARILTWPWVYGWGKKLSRLTLSERLKSARERCAVLQLALSAKNVKPGDIKKLVSEQRWIRLEALIRRKMKETEAMWDLSESAARRYYSKHSEEFVKGGRRLSFEKAKAKVMEKMKSEYESKERKKLDNKYPVRMNEEVVKTLGGVAAPEEK